MIWNMKTGVNKHICTTPYIRFRFGTDLIFFDSTGSPLTLFRYFGSGLGVVFFSTRPSKSDMKKWRKPMPVNETLFVILWHKGLPNLYIWEVILIFFLGNLDLFILATPLMRKHCFRDLEEVEICSFRWLFPRWFQEGFQRRTFRDLCEFRCQIGIHFGFP